MKRIEEELRIIRQQMEEDFLLHNERISAQQKVRREGGTSLEKVEENLQELRESLSRVSESIGNKQDAVATVTRKFRDYAHTSRAYHEGWTSGRQRDFRIPDMIQTGLLTGGLEMDSRLESSGA